MEDDVPPLEDMSELLEQAQQLQRMKERKGISSSSSSSSSSSPHGHVKLEDTASVKVSKEGTCTKQENKSKTPTTTNKLGSKKPASKKPDSFGGMKKGFLFGSAPKSSSKLASQTSKQRSPSKGPSATGKDAASADGPEDIPLIKAKGDGAHNGAQRIQEVQDALKASTPFLENKDWVNDDLLSKIEKHPRLARQLSDPRFSQAMSMFQSNPQGAMKYFQDNPEIQDFFQDFCGILGDHFTNLGSSSVPPPSSAAPKVSPVQEVKARETPGVDMTISTSTDPKQATAADEAKMKEILADPDVVKAFGHPQTRLLFEALQTNPAQAQRMMQNADAEFRQHIQTLVKKGLLGFAR